METCYDSIGEAPPEGASPTTPRWSELRTRWVDLRERVDSEWSAAREAFSGPEPARKWLGWALYRLAASVNPEIRDP